jgi:hypothetical protein
MKTERLLLAMIVATAIFATPSVLTSAVSAQSTTDTAEDGNQGTTEGGGADDESPEDMYNDFQTCLEDAEGTENFATEDEIRTCFIDAGYIQGTDDDSEDGDDNEEENEDNDEETN